MMANNLALLDRYNRGTVVDHVTVGGARFLNDYRSAGRQPAPQAGVRSAPALK
jgi:hypothetical protein